MDKKQVLIRTLVLMALSAMVAVGILLLTGVFDNDEPAPERPQLSAPLNLRLTGLNRTLTWDAVLHAGAYDIYVDGVRAGTTTQSSFSIPPLSLEYGTYELRVRAVGNQNTHRNSILSLPIQLVWEPLPHPED
ncbi:MAG: hypothetical protein FWE38_00900 [Firmicutes bacterium]|nr:hypothetical protein [Bacillota bacterium]